MHRVCVIVFGNDAEADKGKNELLKLDGKGSISIYGYEVISKKTDGTVVMGQADGHGTLTAFAKPLFGNLVPSAIPKTSKPRITNARDSKPAETGDEFLHDVMEVLVPNRVAIVAEIEEECPGVLDRHMESIGGVVLRWTVSEADRTVEM